MTSVGAHGAAAPLPGWGTAGAVTVIKSDKMSADPAVRAVVTAAKEFSASTSLPAAE